MADIMRCETATKAPEYRNRQHKTPHNHAAPSSALCGAPHNVEIGAAWAKQSNEGRAYLGLKLDDPSLTAPIYANLFDDEEGEGYSLIWSRPTRRNGD